MAATPVEMVLLAAPAVATAVETAGSSALDHSPIQTCCTGLHRRRTSSADQTNPYQASPVSPPRYRIRLRHG